jgi:diaminopimelate decarboxylase
MTISTAKSSASTPHHRSRSSSFADIDEIQASGILEDIVRDNHVLLGGSSIGKGFPKAARFYLEQKKKQQQQYYEDNDDEDDSVLEDAFYVVDLGVIVSQVYQWRKYFPRVEPFYAVKCNPDPVILQTLALLGCNFDCASQQEIIAVQQACDGELALPRQPEIIYANPCKARKHLQFAVRQTQVQWVTFDNAAEVEKCAKISTKIQLILRIVTDDRGAQCRLSSKYGAPKSKWRLLLHTAQRYGLSVVGVSFHVGSGCRDASRYFAALHDARALFDMAHREFGFDMTILDIGGGFPGETHSFWNPEVLDDEEEKKTTSEEASSSTSKEGLEPDETKQEKDDVDTPYMFFMEIAEQVAPKIDELFPPSEGVRVIGEPGRYFVAAAATLVTSVVGARSNEMEATDDDIHGTSNTTGDDPPVSFQAISDRKTSFEIFERSREDENAIVRRQRGKSFDTTMSNNSANNKGTTEEEAAVWENITEELNHYAQYFTKQNFVTQETDAYNDGLDLYQEDFATAADLLGVPDKTQQQAIVHSVEGMTKAIIAVSGGDNDDDKDNAPCGIISLAAAGEAAVNGMVLQAVADSAPLQDDYAYYVNDGVYGAFNNLMFDHATVRPRVLRLHNNNDDTTLEKEKEETKDQNLYASTVFGPTCDSIDVIARSVLLPKLNIGDWLYFQNMGAYTMAAASSFNGFTPTEKMYVCSVQPEYFEGLIAGPVQEAAQQDVLSPTTGKKKKKKKTAATTTPDQQQQELTRSTKVATVLEGEHEDRDETTITEEKKDD